MKLVIKKYGINGEGIGYDKKIPIFVKGALKDEEVEVKIIQDYKKYKIAKLINIYKYSKARVKAKCPYYEKCGACSLLHASYDEQIIYKKNTLEESLLKYAGIEENIEVVRSPEQFNYRNSFKLPVKEVNGKLCAGLYSEDSNRFLRIEKCLNHDVLLNKNLKQVLNVLNKYHIKAYDNKSKSGIRYITLRTIDGNCALCLVTGNDKIEKSIVDELVKIKGISSIYQSINISKSQEIYGNQMIHLALKKKMPFMFDGLKMEVSIRSFMQLNTLAANNMYNYVSNLVKFNNELIIEAYSGLGLMSFLLREKARKIVGIEIITDAVNNANKNAKNNDVNNLEFIAGDCADILYHKYRNSSIDYLIVDPPRTGLDDKMLNCLMKAKIDNIIYISCNPSTLSKDLSVLNGRYKINSIKAFDLFPNTQHVESVVFLRRY